MSDKLPPAEDKRCGTYAGYAAHRRRGERSCEPCQEAMSERGREYYRANRAALGNKLPPTEDERCGTSAGYQAHRKRGERPCEPCRESQSEKCRAYREANREALAEKSRAYYEANREARRERDRAYYWANREARREQNRAYREANREALAEKSRAYYEANREALNERHRAYNESNREALNERKRAYYEANRDAIAEQHRAYREANREALAEHGRACRARIANAFAPIAVHKGTPWTAEDDAIIRATWDEPMVSVAAQLRRTPKSVESRRRNLRKRDRARLIGAKK